MVFSTKECNCNTYGTIACSNNCEDETGICTCDTTKYSGDKCDTCQAGFSLNSDTICNGNYIYLGLKLKE